MKWRRHKGQTGECLPPHLALWRWSSLFGHVVGDPARKGLGVEWLSLHSSELFLRGCKDGECRDRQVCIIGLNCSLCVVDLQLWLAE